MIEIKIPAQRAKQANPGGMGPEMAYLMTAKEAASEVAAHRWPHYVYALCSDTGAAFYVGKGAGPRLLAHAAEAAAGGDSAKCQMIRRAGDRLRLKLATAEYAVTVEGVRTVIAAAERAQQQKLAVVCGLQRHHQNGYLETMKRIHGGDLGRLLFARCSWNQGGLWHADGGTARWEARYRRRHYRRGCGQDR